jgi:hypothetical protein
MLGNDSLNYVFNQTKSTNPEVLTGQYFDDIDLFWVDINSMGFESMLDHLLLRDIGQLLDPLNDYNRLQSLVAFMETVRGIGGDDFSYNFRYIDPCFLENFFNQSSVDELAQTGLKALEFAEKKINTNIASLIDIEDLIYSPFALAGVGLACKLIASARDLARVSELEQDFVTSDSTVQKTLRAKSILFGPVIMAASLLFKPPQDAKTNKPSYHYPTTPPGLGKNTRPV